MIARRPVATPFFLPKVHAATKLTMQVRIPPPAPPGALVRRDRESDRREPGVVLRSPMQPDQPGARRTGTAVGALAAYAAVCVAVIATVMASRDVTAIPSRAAVDEGVAGILLRSAGGLHHAVEGQERLNGELHVNAHGTAH